MTQELHMNPLVYVLREPFTLLANVDCRSIESVLFPHCDGPTIRLVFADPPFNNGSAYDTWDDRMDPADYEHFTMRWMQSCTQLSADNAAMWINIDDANLELILRCARILGWKQMNHCIWHFRFGQAQKNKFTVSKTHALWFVKDPADYVFEPQRVVVESVRQQMGDIRAEPEGKIPLDVWGFERFWGRIQGNNKERTTNVNQLPEAYLSRIIKACSNELDLVFDPFCGSGTTATVARALGRRSVTCDVSSRYIEAAYRRVIGGLAR